MTVSIPSPTEFLEPSAFAQQAVTAEDQSEKCDPNDEEFRWMDVR